MNTKLAFSVRNAAAAFALVLATLGSGCASQKFAYPTPTPRLLPAGFSVAVAPVVDWRNSRSLDRVFGKSLLADMQSTLVAELEGMGRYSKVIASAEPTADTDAQISVTLTKLESVGTGQRSGGGGLLNPWAVGQMMGPNVGAAYGLVSAVKASASDATADVHSLVEFQFRMVKTKDSRVLLEREYRGIFATSDATRGFGAVKAFQNAMQELRRDLGGN
jgi:hypothetical protein